MKCPLRWIRQHVRGSFTAPFTEIGLEQLYDYYYVGPIAHAPTVNGFMFSFLASDDGSSAANYFMKMLYYITISGTEA